METNIFLPHIYKRGPGVIKEIGEFCRKKAEKVFIIGGEKALKAVEKQLVESLTKFQVQILDIQWYGGECTWDNINKLSQIIKNNGSELLIAVGGGKALDTGKAVAYQCDIHCITVPTIAATCAAYTPLSIIHNELGEFVSNTPQSSCPVGVFVDTHIVLHAPAKWLYAGMGDTLAKWYELRATTSNIPTTSWTIGGITNGEICYQIIKEFGSSAKEAVEKQVANEALNYVIDAIIFYAGMSSVLGGEDCRGAAAHSVYFGFTNVPSTHQVGHGLLVGFGNLCLLALEKHDPEEIIEEIKLAKKCGVPTKLSEIANLSLKDLIKISEVAANAKAMKNMPFKVSPKMVLEAMEQIDELSNKLDKLN